MRIAWISLGRDVDGTTRYPTAINESQEVDCQVASVSLTDSILPAYYRGVASSRGGAFPARVEETGTPLSGSSTLRLMGNSVSRGGIAIQMLNGIAIEGFGTYRLRKIHADLTADELRKLVKDLERIRELRGPVSR